MSNESKLKSELKEILDTLIDGSQPEYKEAKKQIGKIYHSQDRDIFQKAAIIVFGYINIFDKIKTNENKAAFCSGLYFFYLSLSDDYFDMLKDFTLKAIQNPDGHVREAIRNTSEWLLISLTDRMEPFIWEKGKGLTEKQKEDQIIARVQFRKFISEVEELMYKYSLPENARVKYIHKMKPSVEKSLQTLYSRLSDFYKYAVNTPLEIKKKRNKIKSDLARTIKKYKVDITVHEVLDIIYNENDHKDIFKIINKFKNVSDIDELNSIQRVISIAWNYFPHRSLKGLSPKEMYLESLN